MIQQLLAAVSVIQPPTPCDMEPHYSVHVNPRRFCRAGKEFVAVYQSHFVALPKRDAWLLVSTAPPSSPIPLQSIGMDGCWLLVNPDPRHLQVLVPNKDDMLTQRPGRLILRWTPPDTMRGAVLYSQMIWADPEANEARHLIGPMLRIRVE